jgi:phage replication-related protein YjqB (UPF0714/DUF867 family)
MVEELPKLINETKDKVKPYHSFADLVKSEVLGKDFEIQVEKRDSGIAIVAPHGGRIEPYTTEIAHYVAGDIHSFYSLLGLKDSGNAVMHISSNLFDEPEALKLAKTVSVVITIHGMKGDEIENIVLGGLNRELIEKIKQQLVANGFDSEVASLEGALSGAGINNICNRGILGKGVQIEISRKLRQRLIEDKKILEKFKQAVVGQIS